MSDPAAQALRERARARVGTMLKQKWRLDSLLGIGGMAAVYAATHRNGARVAIKLLYPELATRTDIAQRFTREGYVANKVAHPGAVRVLDDDVSEEGEPFLVMDLLDGISLETLRRMRGGRIPVAEVLAIADGLLDVVAAAHAVGIIHRDIKPQNVFVLESAGGFKVSLLDFGVARLLDGSASSTISGGVLGTPAFMAPEQAAGRPQIGAQADVWSVGATMFKLLSGRFVHEADNLQAHLVMAAVSIAPALATVAPDVPAPIAAIVDCALAFDAARRFPDARAMQSAIRSVTGVCAPIIPAIAAAAPDASSDVHELTASDLMTVPTPVSAPLEAIPPSVAAHAVSHSFGAPRRARARIALALAAIAVAVVAGAWFFAARSSVNHASAAPAASPAPDVSGRDEPAAQATEPIAAAPPASASATTPVTAASATPSVTASAQAASKHVTQPPPPATKPDPADPMSRRKF